MKHLLWAFLTLCAQTLPAQIQIERQVFGSIGISHESDLNIDLTFGETFIGLEQNSELTLSSGFHQNISLLTSTANPTFENWSIYPNPTSREFQIKDFKEGFTAQVINSLGQAVTQSFALREKTVSVDHLSSGQYILIVRDKTREYKFPFVITK